MNQMKFPNFLEDQIEGDLPLLNTPIKSWWHLLPLAWRLPNHNLQRNYRMIWLGTRLDIFTQIIEDLE